MTARSKRTLAWFLAGLSWILSAIGLGYLIASAHVPLPAQYFGPKGFGVSMSVVIAAMGLLIALKRPENPIGWIALAGATASAFSAVADGYAIWAVAGQGSTSLPARLAAISEEWNWMPGFISLGVIMALFPDGRPISKKWGRGIWILVTASLLAAFSFIFTAKPLIFPGTVNPLALPGAFESGTFFSAGFFALLILAGSSLVVRFRRSRGDQREQMKWLVLSSLMVVGWFLVYFVSYILSGNDASKQWPNVFEVMISIAVMGVPVSIAIGILKYRLYDIDIVIRRTVVYAILAALIVIVGIAAVLLARLVAGETFRHDTSALFLAGLVVGIVLLPLRNLATRIAGRVVFGGRATPYEVLSNLSDQLAGASSLEEVLPETARLIVENTGAQRASIWISEGGGRRVAVWPPDATAAGDEQVFPVVHQGEHIGDVRVQESAREPLTDPQRKLISEVATQAGLVLRNVALIEDLRASRQRLVAAQDEERRKIERNLHDGAQQQLIALGIKVNLAKTLAPKDADKTTQILEGVQGELQEAIDTLRDLARGIYPPLLADQGLAAALEAQARKAAIPTTVASDSIGRYPQEVEAAAYFCCLEALQNVAKYANASQATITLSASEQELTFTVADDGEGFDASATNYGTGLQGMADRLDAIGGTLKVESTPGEGTTVTGTLPIASGVAS